MVGFSRAYSALLGLSMSSRRFHCRSGCWLPPACMSFPFQSLRALFPSEPCMAIPRPSFPSEAAFSPQCPYVSSHFLLRMTSDGSPSSAFVGGTTSDRWWLR